MNLLRKYKISKILNKPLSRLEQDIVDYINTWISDLTITNLSDEDGLYYFNKDQFVAAHLITDTKPTLELKFLYLKCNEILNVLENDYLIKKNDAKQLFLYFFNLKYNTNLDIIGEIEDKELCKEVEERYRNELNKKIQNIENTQ